MDSNIYVPDDETERSHDYGSGSRICTRLAGVTFDGRKAVISRMSIGEKVLLKREPNNPYDHNAIRVERSNGQQIGYLNRHLASTLATIFELHCHPVPAYVHCLTGSPRQGYSLGVVITFNVP